MVARSTVPCVPDPAHRLPGRGAHLHPVVACLDLAERRKAFPRALRVPPPLTTDLVRRELAGDAGERPDLRPGVPRGSADALSCRTASRPAPTGAVLARPRPQQRHNRPIRKRVETLMSTR